MYGGILPPTDDSGNHRSGTTQTESLGNSLISHTVNQILFLKEENFTGKKIIDGIIMVLVLLVHVQHTALIVFCVLIA